MFKHGHKQCLQALLTSRPLSTDASICTYVRTDGLTKNYSPLEHVLTFVNVRGGAAKDIPDEGQNRLGDAVQSVLCQLVEADFGKRHPVIRTSRDEDRRPISPHLRRVIYARDHFRCVWCGKDRQAGYRHRLVLDHITPWSAGGSDHPNNLRTLCWSCNAQRSNRVSLDEAWKPLPITASCVACCECCAECKGIDLEDPRIGPAFCWWHLKATRGIVEDETDEFSFLAWLIAKSEEPTHA